MSQINTKKFQTTQNTTQNTTQRKQNNAPTLKMNKSLSPRNVFDRLTNQEKIAEVTGFQKTLVVKKSQPKPGPKEVQRGVIQERLR